MALNARSVVLIGHRFARRQAIRLGLTFAFVAGSISAVEAAPSPTVHWERTQPEIAPTVINSLPADMRADLTHAVTAWNVSPVVESAIKAEPTRANACGLVQGTIRFCTIENGRAFPFAAEVFFDGGGHILAVRASMQRSFIAQAPFDTTEGRRAMLCELQGLALGLVPRDFDLTNSDLVDESGQQTCMDLTLTPAGNENPDAADLAALAALYAHSHTDFGVREFAGQADKQVAKELDVPAQVDASSGIVKRKDVAGRPVILERQLPGRIMVRTHLFWGE